MRLQEYANPNAHLTGFLFGVLWGPSWRDPINLFLDVETAVGIERAPQQGQPVKIRWKDPETSALLLKDPKEFEQLLKIGTKLEIFAEEGHRGPKMVVQALKEEPTEGAEASKQTPLSILCQDPTKAVSEQTGCEWGDEILLTKRERDLGRYLRLCPLCGSLLEGKLPEEFLNPFPYELKIEIG